MKTIFLAKDESDAPQEFAPLDLANIPREGDELATRDGTIYRVLRVMWMPFGRTGGNTEDPCVLVVLTEIDDDGFGSQREVTIRTESG